MTPAQRDAALIVLACANLVLLLVVAAMTGYVFYVVHHTVEALREVAGQWQSVP